MLTRSTVTWPITRSAAALFMAIALAGCASTTETGGASADAEPAGEFDETSRLLDEYAKGLGVDEEPTTKAGELRANISPVTEAEGEIIVDANRNDEDEIASESTNRKTRIRAGVSGDEQIDALAYELAELLAERAGEDAEGVGFGDLARLALLDAISPGVFNSNFLGASGEAALTTEQRETLTAFGELVRESVGSMGDALDEEHLALYRIVSDREREWRGWGEFRIPEAHLCTAVYDFGNYKTMNTDGDGRYRLIAGRRYRSVVYVEIAGYTHEKAVREGVPGYESRVAMSMSLYQHHDSDENEDAKGDLLAWKTAEESVEDFSRNPRRDFFLVQTIDLPETLSTGRYTLKIRMRDLQSDRQTERRIPIDVVSLSGGQIGAAASR